jgi:hypothetical protein
VWRVGVGSEGQDCGLTQSQVLMLCLVVV